MLWAVLVMLMISLISSGVIFLGRAYYMQERKENYRIQAKLYAESAIDLIQTDICKNGASSAYVTSDNATKTYMITFPDAGNWDCVVTVNHSMVVTSSGGDGTENPDASKNMGEIYLTAKVTRKTTGGKAEELAQVCAKLTNYDGTGWVFAGYYHL